MKIRRILRDVFLWVLGSGVFSISVNMFSAPNGIVQGGLTGIATVINKLLPYVPIGTAIFIMNIPLFILGWKKLRGSFIIRTVCATSVFTLLIDIGSLFIEPYTGDKLLGCIFCGVLSGVGLALVFITGATTGGTDIIAMLARKKFPRLSMGRIILFIDFAVVVLSFLAYGEIESIMYAIIVIFLSSRVIDTVICGSDHSKLVMIVTGKAQEILSAILLEIGRGATVLPVRGGYTGQDKNLVLCAARKTQIRNILHLISLRDPAAFTIVCDAREIMGEGFR